MGFLGDYNVDVLLKTLVFQVGSSNSGNAHGGFYFPKLYEAEYVYMVYCEDVSKTNQGGLSSRKRNPTNQQDHSRCFVHLYT